MKHDEPTGLDDSWYCFRFDKAYDATSHAMREGLGEDQFQEGLCIRGDLSLMGA